MTAAGLTRSVRGTPRRELTLVLLLGAAGAGLVLLATRQGWADVETAAPRPLPAGVIRESGQALAPAASALAVAALAGLAAVLATRRMLRRVAGVVLAAFGAGIAAAVSTGISAADVLAAASGSASSQAAADAGTAGSTTAGTSGAAAAPLPGFPAHVVFAGFPWRPVAVVGAIAVMAAGVLVAWRAERLPVMSARFERPAPSAGGRPPRTAAQRAESGSQGAGQRGSQGAAERGQDPADSAAMWESLSRGEDPTSPG
jgi:uncharacterized membrane protein (TIGR02234 family)